MVNKSPLSDLSLSYATNGGMMPLLPFSGEVMVAVSVTIAT